MRRRKRKPIDYRAQRRAIFAASNRRMEFGWGLEDATLEDEIRAALEEAGFMRDLVDMRFGAPEVVDVWEPPRTPEDRPKPGEKIFDETLEREIGKVWMLKKQLARPLNPYHPDPRIREKTATRLANAEVKVATMKRDYLKWTTAQKRKGDER